MKLTAIKNMKSGHLAKIFLEWTQPWWTKGSIAFFKIANTKIECFALSYACRFKIINVFYLS
jgi:hypothetical protein